MKKEFYPQASKCAKKMVYGCRNSSYFIENLILNRLRLSIYLMLANTLYNMLLSC